VGAAQGSRADAKGRRSMSQLIDSSIARQFERLPPHAIESEMCMLASMILDRAGGVIGDVLEVVDDESHLFQADHQIIYRVLKSLHEDGRPIDAMILREELAKRQVLEEVGGHLYLAEILSSVPNPANGAHYARAVRDTSTLRRLISASSDILREAYSPHEDVREIVERAERSIFAVAEERAGGVIQPVQSAVHEAFETMGDRGQR
jgi:replicative DNA helicase